jgi:hypothetical protein
MRLLVLVLSLVFTQAASAESFLCHLNRTIAYRLVLGTSTGDITKYINSASKSVPGKVQVSRLNDDFGNLVIVELASAKKPVDWNKISECWAVAGEPHARFEIRHLTSGNYEGTLVQIPNIVYKPNVRCFPRPPSISTVKIDCRPVR